MTTKKYILSLSSILLSAAILDTAQGLYLEMPGLAGANTNDIGGYVKIIQNLQGETKYSELLAHHRNILKLSTTSNYTLLDPSWIIFSKSTHLQTLLEKGSTHPNTNSLFGLFDLVDEIYLGTNESDLTLGHLIRPVKDIQPVNRAPKGLFFYNDLLAFSENLHRDDGARMNFWIKETYQPGLFEWQTDADMRGFAQIASRAALILPLEGAGQRTVNETKNVPKMGVNRAENGVARRGEIFPKCKRTPRL
jgi:hypothetical protein